MPPWDERELWSRCGSWPLGYPLPHGLASHFRVRSDKFVRRRFFLAAVNAPRWQSCGPRTRIAKSHFNMPAIQLCDLPVDLLLTILVSCGPVATAHVAMVLPVLVRAQIDAW